MLLDDKQVRVKCHIGEGARCCRYLAMSAEGFCCESTGPFKATLDMRAMRGYMTARAGPCRDPYDPASEAVPFGLPPDPRLN